MGTPVSTRRGTTIQDDDDDDGKEMNNEGERKRTDLENLPAISELFVPPIPRAFTSAH